MDKQNLQNQLPDQGGSTAAKLPSLLFPGREIFPDQSSPSRVRFAAFRALDCSGPILAGPLFMRERGELQAEGGPLPGGLRKGAILQLPGSGRTFKGLEIAKQYCRTNLFCNIFMQC